MLESVHSKRTNSGVSNKYPKTENHEHLENDQHSKRVNKKTPSIPDSSVIVENLDTTPGPIEKHAEHLIKEPPISGKINRKIIYFL